MAEHVNHLGQPIGFPLPKWTARPRPPRTGMEGCFCTVEPADPTRHAADLHAAYLRDKEGREVDFVVTRNRRVHWLIEVKASDGAISTSLAYYTRKLNPDQALQLVLNLERPEERSGIKIVRLAEWLEALS